MLNKPNLSVPEFYTERHQIARDSYNCITGYHITSPTASLFDSAFYHVRFFTGILLL